MFVGYKKGLKVLFYKIINQVISCTHLAIRSDDVDKTEEWYEQRQHQEAGKLPIPRQTLKKQHFLAIPDACQVLLGVWVSYKLNRTYELILCDYFGFKHSFQHKDGENSVY